MRKIVKVEFNYFEFLCEEELLTLHAADHVALAVLAARIHVEMLDLVVGDEASRVVGRVHLAGLVRVSAQLFGADHGRAELLRELGVRLLLAHVGVVILAKKFEF